jgi:transcriptional regulator with XRE-family HTH domain
VAIGEKLRKVRMARGLTTSEVAAATHMKVQAVEALERDDFSRMAAPIYVKGFIRMYAGHLGLDPQPLIDDYLDRHPQGDKHQPSLDVRKENRPAARPVARKPAVKSAARPASTPAAPPPPEPAAVAKETEPAADLFVAPVPLPRKEERLPAEPVVERSPGGLSHSAARGIDDLARGTASLVVGGKDLVEDRVHGVRDWWQDHTFDFSWFHFSGSPIKVASVAIGIIVVLVFIISSLSRCVRTASGPLSGMGGRQSDELLLAADPPDVYID